VSAREEIVVRLYNEGWREAAFDVVFDLIDPEIVWTAIEDAPDAGTYRGHEGVRGYMQDWLNDFDLGYWSIEESIHVGDRLVCVQRGRATGKGSGVGGDIHYACVYSFGEDNRIVEVSEFATRGDALAAVERDSPPERA
jgi:ketosteroid isomerase-like protein